MDNYTDGKIRNCPICSSSLETYTPLISKKNEASNGSVGTICITWRCTKCGCTSMTRETFEKIVWLGKLEVEES
jgi:uncharacterized Zn finger protein